MSSRILLAMAIVSGVNGMGTISTDCPTLYLGPSDSWKCGNDINGNVQWGEYCGYTFGGETCIDPESKADGQCACCCSGSGYTYSYPGLPDIELEPCDGSVAC